MPTCVSSSRDPKGPSDWPCKKMETELLSIVWPKAVAKRLKMALWKETLHSYCYNLFIY